MFNIAPFMSSAFEPSTPLGRALQSRNGTTQVPQSLPHFQDTLEMLRRENEGNLPPRNPLPLFIMERGGNVSYEYPLGPTPEQAPAYQAYLDAIPRWNARQSALAQAAQLGPKLYGAESQANAQVEAAKAQASGDPSRDPVARLRDDLIRKGIEQGLDTSRAVRSGMAGETAYRNALLQQSGQQGPPELVPLHPLSAKEMLDKYGMYDTKTGDLDISKLALAVEAAPNDPTSHFEITDYLHQLPGFNPEKARSLIEWGHLQRERLKRGNPVPGKDYQGSDFAVRSSFTRDLSGARGAPALTSMGNVYTGDMIVDPVTGKTSAWYPKGAPLKNLPSQADLAQAQREATALAKLLRVYYPPTAAQGPR